MISGLGKPVVLDSPELRSFWNFIAPDSLFFRLSNGDIGVFVACMGNFDGAFVSDAVGVIMASLSPLCPLYVPFVPFRIVLSFSQTYRSSNFCVSFGAAFANCMERYTADFTVLFYYLYPFNIMLEESFSP